jgi:hypothetical protein
MKAAAEGSVLGSNLNLAATLLNAALRLYANAVPKLRT